MQPINRNLINNLNANLCEQERSQNISQVHWEVPSFLKDESSRSVDKDEAEAHIEQVDETWSLKSDNQKSNQTNNRTHSVDC